MLIPGPLQRFANHPLAAKLLRFAVTGAISGFAFGAVTLAALKFLGIAPTAATVIGYIAVLPLSFIGHRRLTFRSAGKITPEFRRFCLSFVAGLLASVLAMHAATIWLGLAPFYGIALSILVVPVITFLIMNSWVFRDQNGQKGFGNGA
jgi:putative flippase GtrA